MENPFKWLFKQKQIQTREIRLSPNKDPASECSSPGLSSSSSPGKKLKVTRFLGVHIRPPLF